MEKTQSSTMTSTMKKGTELLVQALEDEGVDVLFGYPGGAVIDIFDQFYKSETNHILARHEQGAAHMADGYARATGRPGVCIVTSGPGATNTVTAITTAMMDSIPMVVITGQVTENGIGKDAFQEVDVQGLMTPITKYVYQVRDAGDIQRIVKEALYIANTGRKGPVVIDIPKNIGNDYAEPKNHDEIEMDLPGYEPEKLAEVDHDVTPVMEALKEAEKPLFLFGHGVSLADAEEELTEFIEKYKIPAISTLLGQGAYPVRGKYNLGFAGMHGTYAANMAIVECDLLINIGSRFDDRVATNPDNFAPNAKIAHFDIDASELGKIIDTDFPYQADAKQALRALLDYEMEGYEAKEEWIKHCFDNRKKHPIHYEQKDTILAHRAVEYVGEVTDGEALVVSDVGQHQMWVAQAYPYEHGDQHLTSGGLGTMGFAVPAAIGAKMGARDRDVVCFVGDGGFQMTNQEMNILKENDLNVKFFLFNNSSLGMVRQWQTLFYDKRYSHTISDNLPDFVKLSEALGVTADRVSDPSELEAAIDKAFAHDGSYLLEIVISGEDIVYPMVAAGDSNDEMRGVYTCTD